MATRRRLNILIVSINLILLGTAINGQKDIVQITVGEEDIELTSPGYPDYVRSGADIKWKLNTNNPLAKIQLLCGDLRLIRSNPCEDFISIDDGNSERKLCGGQSGLTVTSKETTLDIYLHIGPHSSGILYCNARLILPIIPTEVTLKLRDAAYLLLTPKNMTKYLEKRWIFRTEPGIRLSLTCLDFRFPDSNPCSQGMEVDNGETSKIYCGSQNGLIIFSHDQEIKVKLFTGFYGGGGGAKCMIQAINGPSHLQYENEVSEEIDSSEHGVQPGRVGTTCQCGWTNKKVGRIAHGHETGINEYPWMVAIRESLKPGASPPPLHFCGGSIITHYHILSAAHCVYDRMDEELYAVVGEHNIRTSTETQATQSHKIVQKIMPDDYVNEIQHHDIAVLIVETPIVFNQFVGPLCLSSEKFDVAYKHLLATGWGLTHLGRASDTLQKAHIRAIDLNVCASIWGFQFSADNDAHKVCIDSRSKDTCPGDSGGPLVILDKDTNRYVQVSLVSFGDGCMGHKPSISTEIYPFYQWILRQIQETYPQEMVCNKQV